MQTQKLIHELCEASKHMHLPLLVGLVSYVRVTPKYLRDKFSDLGDVPGDNVLPKVILDSLISRRSL